MWDRVGRWGDEGPDVLGAPAPSHGHRAFIDSAFIALFALSAGRQRRSNYSRRRDYDGIRFSRTVSVTSARQRMSRLLCIAFIFNVRAYRFAKVIRDEKK